jgi:hypothetical protein
MTMTIDQVRAGHFFVSEKKGLVREITSETPDGNVHWRSYNLSDGRPTGDSLVCSAGHILRWADREATAQEVARMQIGNAHALDVTRIKEFAYKFLTGVPTEMLLAELRRRGYDVVGR